MPATHKSPRTIFLEAVENHAPDAWPKFLDTACGDDDTLRNEVQRLLAAHIKDDSFLKRPAVLERFAAHSFGHSAEYQLGTQIGRYKLIELLGEGGMGVVYIAEQTEPVRRRVALKIIKPGLDSRRVIARFEAERQTLALMDHPNIARVLDAGTTDRGLPYFVMELVNGLPLTRFCTHHKLPLPEQLKLFITVCQAVQHAHQKGIIHRDLKPSNVLLAMIDGQPVPKVIDFGVAKAISSVAFPVGEVWGEGVPAALPSEPPAPSPLPSEPQSLPPSLHTGRAVIGTALYMSPEQAALKADIDTRSDVYSLGVLLYELLTGTTPFESETLHRLGLENFRHLIQTEIPERPSVRLANRSRQRGTHSVGRRDEALQHSSFGLQNFRELDHITLKALQKAPAHRYESASALAADINHYLHGEPVQAYPSSPLYRSQKLLNKHKVALAVVFLVGVSLLASTLISSYQATRALAAEKRAKQMESSALLAAQAERDARQMEETQRRRAETGEERAENNLKVALEAVDGFVERFIASQGGMTRIAEADRSIYRLAIESCCKLAVDRPDNPTIRLKVANTLLDLELGGDELVGEELFKKACDTAAALLRELVAEHHDSVDFLQTLADTVAKEADRGGRTAKVLPQLSEVEAIYAEIAEKSHDHNQRRAALRSQVDCLIDRSHIFQEQGEAAQSKECLNKALFIHSNAEDHAAVVMTTNLCGHIFHRTNYSVEEQGKVMRDLIARHRRCLRNSPDLDTPTNWRAMALCLDYAANRVKYRDPQQADEYFSEAIDIYREGNTPKDLPWSPFSETLRDYAKHLRLYAKSSRNTDSDDKKERRRMLADSIYREAIEVKRQKIDSRSFDRSASQKDELVDLIQERACFIIEELCKAVPISVDLQGDCIRKNEAKELLTEAITLCRAIAIKFPNWRDPTSRTVHEKLTALENLYTQHFGELLKVEVANDSDAISLQAPQP